VGVHGGAPSI